MRMRVSSSSTLLSLIVPSPYVNASENRIILRMKRTASRTNARASTARTLVNVSTTAEANGRRSSRRSAMLTGKRCDERQCAIVAFH